MANIVENIMDLGLWEGGKETVRDIFGKGEHTVAAKFTVTDKNGEKKEVQNSAAGPIYRTPSGGFTNTRSYAYLTNGDNGKLTLNVSRDLYDSDTFKEKFLENSTFKEVLKSYNANKNADTVVPVTKTDGTTENMKFSDLVKSYDEALKSFASSYEKYSTFRDEVRNNTGFELTDDEIRVAANYIDDDDKKSDTKVIFLPDEWLSIYDFSKLGSFDADTKTVSAKDFFNVYDLDKKNGINEDAWNQLKATSDAVVANAYAYSDDSKEYSMKKNVEEDAGGDEEVMNKAKDRLARAIQASNLLSEHNPEISFLHKSSIFASNAVLTLGNSFVQVVNKAATFEAMAFDTYKYAFDVTVAAIKDEYSQHIALMGAAIEDIDSGDVTVENYNQYIDGILVSSTDGSQSEVDKVRAEFEAKLASGDTLTQMSYAEGTKGYDLNEAVKWNQGYTASINPRAAKAGIITGQAIFLAIEVALANKAGAAAGDAIYAEGAAAKSALSTIFGKGVSLSSRLNTFATFLGRNKAVSWAGNLTVQALVDTFAFEDNETFINAWSKLDPEARSTISRAFAENFVGNAAAEIVGIGSSAIGSSALNSKNPIIRGAAARMAKVANAISLPKKKAQLIFANTKIAKFLSRPLGKGARQAADMAFKAMSNNPNAIFKASTLEEWNVEKFKIEYEATKNIAKAKKGVQYVTDLEKNTTKIAETTTEAIVGKLNEKTNFLVEAAKITDGAKIYAREIYADEMVSATWKETVDGAENVQKILKWSEYNPTANRFLSQDASNYVANKTHYDDLFRKKEIREAAGKTLSAGEEKKLEDLRLWLKEFAERNGDPAVDALNVFIEKEQAFNKALTDWQVRHGVMSQGKYDSLSGTGIFGENDELYVRTVAMPDGKSMDEIDEMYEQVAKLSDVDFMEKTGYSTGVRDVNTIFEQDLHLSNKISDNYLDPILVNSMTVLSMAKAYQGKMWGNALNAIKAPLRELDVNGKPMTKSELNKTIKQASNAAAESMSKMASDDLKNLEGGGSIGTAYQDTRLTNKKGVSKIELREQAVNNKLGIGNDKQIITNTQKLTEEQTKNIMASFGEDAPIYGKVKTKAELDETFASLSEKQKDQALKSMGINPVETKRTINVEKKNPEYAAWKKEKAAFEKQQAKDKLKFEKEQAKATKAASTKQSNKQLEKDANDAVKAIFREDPKTWKSLSEEDIDKMFTVERQNELSDMIKDDFDMDKFRDLDNPTYKDVLDPEYIKKVQGAGTATSKPAKPFEEKAFDKPSPDEFIYETKTKVEKNKIKAIDEPGAMRAWNRAMSSEGLADDLNKIYISERVAPAEGGPKKMSDDTRKMLTGYIAENTKNSFYSDLSIEGKSWEEWNAEIARRTKKEGEYLESVKRLEDARAMAKAVEAGKDPFTKNIHDVAETAIESGIGKLSRNPVAESLKKAAEAYGIEDDTVYRYYTLSGMVEVNKEGETVLAKNFKDAFQNRLRTHMIKNPRAEGELGVTSMEASIKESTEKLEEYVTSEWRKQQQFLSSLGANDIIDTNKMFDSINGELSKIVDDVTRNRNVVQILDENGNYKFVEVDPIVADLYRSRPYVLRDDDAFMRKMSRMARLGNTTFNLKSVMNQNFKDVIQSTIMAGLSHSVKTYSKEIADMFGDELVKYLRESMGEAGWDKFAEGLTEEEAKLKAANLLTEGNLGSKGFSGELTSSKLFQSGNAPEDYTTQAMGAASEAYRKVGYSKKLGMADKKKAKKDLLTWLEDHAPGNYINNARETYLRKANYAAAFNDALKRGQTVGQARRTAEFVSRNATTNFRNTFMWGNYICDNVPFLSAAINGSASFWRLFEMDPLAILTRINAVGFATIAQVISSGQRYEDRETLRNVPDYVKRSNAVFIYDGTPFKIPLPEEVAIFLAPYRQAAEKMLGSENRSWVELLYNDALDISPIDLDGFSTEDQTALTKNEGLMSRMGRQIQVMVSQCTPPIVQTIIMGVTGEDPYTGNPIDTAHVYYDENGIPQIMSYSTSESAKFLANIANKFNWNISASAAEKLIEKAMGTGGQQFLDGLVGLGEVMFGQSLDDEKVDATKLLTTPLENALTGVAGSAMVEEYQIRDKYDTDFKNMIRNLTAEKNKLLAPDSRYSGIVSKLGSLNSSAENYETQKKNLTREALQEIEDFRNRAMNTVNSYVNHYGSDYDDKKFASVVALLNFDTPTVLPVTAKDFQDATNAYYRGRQDAYQTMIDLGFSSPSDYSILGITKRNAQTGEIYTKYYSPVAILNAGNAVFSNMAEGVNAEIAAALEVAGITRSDMFDGYYKAKAQGSAAAKQYKKDWNAKVVKAIAPTVYQYGADTVLENSVVQDYLDNYIFISNPYSTEKYLKEIFEVED